MPPKTIMVPHDDIEVECKVVRAMQLLDGSWELLIQFGDTLEYFYCTFL